jgi:hypothetical protein
VYPSKVQIYKPLSLSALHTLETCSSAAARAVVDVPSAIAAAKHTKAQAKAKELIILLTNFVFMIVLVLSGVFFLVLLLLFLLRVTSFPPNGCESP